MAIKRKFPAKTATVHCSGGCRAKRDENGGLLCDYGCVACGACVEACRFGAVQINDLGCAEVNEEKCIGCKYCMMACPYGVRDWNKASKKKEIFPEHSLFRKDICLKEELLNQAKEKYVRFLTH